MIAVRYVVLLLLMLVALYYAGRNFSKHGRILSQAGIGAIIVYTLNEGLRFGRGIDYNLYWQDYDYFSVGWDIHQNIGFYFIEKFFVYFDLPFQALVLFMSLMFILGTLFLMKRYLLVAMYALPLWAIMSKGAVENMLRWYLAYSFILIGLSFLLSKDRKGTRLFVAFSAIGCTIHYAIIPIPIILYLILLRSKPIFTPFTSISLFALLALLFETSMLLPVADLINNYSFLFGTFSGYAENADFWLTNNAMGTSSSGLNKPSILIIVFILLFGYRCVEKADPKFVFAYNLFVIGAIFYTVGNRIEIFKRFDMIFYFYGAIVLGFIIKSCKGKQYTASILSLFVIFLLLYNPLKDPFIRSSKLFMYVWDKNRETPDAMLVEYLTDKYKTNKNYESKESRRKQLRRD